MDQDAETIARALLERESVRITGGGLVGGQADWRAEALSSPGAMTVDVIDRVIDLSAEYGLRVEGLVLGSKSVKRIGLDPTAPGAYRRLPVRTASARGPFSVGFAFAAASLL